LSRDTMQRVAAGLSVVALAAAVLHLHAGLAQVLHGMRSLHGLQPTGLVVALALSALSMLISGALWSRLLLCLGHKLPLRVGLAAYLGAGLASYVVNVAGSAAGSAVLLGRHGISVQRATLLALLANTLGFCGMLLWAPMGLFLLADTGASVGPTLFGQHSVVAVGALLAALVLGMLAVLKVLTAVLSADNTVVRRLVGKKVGVTGSAIRVRPLLMLVPWSAASWLVGAIALYALLDALSPKASLNPGTVIGALALANILGSLAFFVPAGVGVRDGALVTLLAHGTGLPVAECTAAAIGMRALDLGTKLSMMMAIGAGVALRLSGVGYRIPDETALPEERQAAPGGEGVTRSRAEVIRRVVGAPLAFVDAHVDRGAAAVRRKDTGGNEEPDLQVLADAA
jgi:glycosyltransferase 2 family protein